MYSKFCTKCGVYTYSSFSGGNWKCQNQFCENDLTKEPLIQGEDDRATKILRQHHTRVTNEISNSINFRTVEILKGQQEILEEVLNDLEGQE